MKNKTIYWIIGLILVILFSSTTEFKFMGAIDDLSCTSNEDCFVSDAPCCDEPYPTSKLYYGPICDMMCPDSHNEEMANYKAVCKAGQCELEKICPTSECVVMKNAQE